MADVDESFFPLKIDVDESIQQLERYGAGTPRHVAGPLAELERKLKAWYPGMCPEVEQGLGLRHIRPDRIGGENLQRLTRIATAAFNYEKTCVSTDTTSLSFPC
jgi:hypothetical protein